MVVTEGGLSAGRMVWESNGEMVSKVLDIRNCDLFDDHVCDETNSLSWQSG